MAIGLGKREQKRAVALMLMQAAGDILEFWSDRDDTEDIDIIDAREWLATWLRGLPGDQWDIRLDHPKTKEN